MRRGGFGKEQSDQPAQEPVVITTYKVLHPLTRAVIGGALMGCGIVALFFWDWRYVAAGLMVTLGCLIIGPWRDPQPFVLPPEAPDSDLEGYDG